MFLFPQLPLLKALIDRLLQDGIEELLRVLGTSQKTNENTKTHTSNIITEYTVRILWGKVCEGSLKS